MRRSAAGGAVGGPAGHRVPRHHRDRLQHRFRPRGRRNRSAERGRRAVSSQPGRGLRGGVRPGVPQLQPAESGPAGAGPGGLHAGQRPGGQSEPGLERHRSAQPAGGAGRGHHRARPAACRRVAARPGQRPAHATGRAGSRRAAAAIRTGWSAVSGCGAKSAASASTRSTAVRCWSWRGGQAPSWPGERPGEKTPTCPSACRGCRWRRCRAARRTPGFTRRTGWVSSPRPRDSCPGRRGRPFVWFEDELQEKAAAAALASQPHLVVLVDPAVGLTRLHLDEAARWLLALREGGRVSALSFTAPGLERAPRLVSGGRPRKTTPRRFTDLAGHRTLVRASLSYGQWQDKHVEQRCIGPCRA